MREPRADCFFTRPGHLPAKSSDGDRGHDTEPQFISVLREAEVRILQADTVRKPVGQFDEDHIVGSTNHFRPDEPNVFSWRLWLRGRDLHLRHIAGTIPTRVRSTLADTSGCHTAAEGGGTQARTTGRNIEVISLTSEVLPVVCVGFIGRFWERGSAAAHRRTRCPGSLPL